MPVGGSMHLPCRSNYHKRSEDQGVGARSGRTVDVEHVTTTRNLISSSNNVVPGLVTCGPYEDEDELSAPSFLINILIVGARGAQCKFKFKLDLQVTTQNWYSFLINRDRTAITERTDRSVILWSHSWCANTTKSSVLETRTALPEADDHTDYSEQPSPPIHSLPPEILSEIFLLAIKDLDPYNILDLLPDGPRLLEKVCLRWQDIVWGCAALWSTFKVDEVPRPKAIGPKLLLDALQRTGQSELSFTIHLSNTPRPIVMESLVQHSFRWKEVSLRSCQESWNIIPDRRYYALAAAFGNPATGPELKPREILRVSSPRVVHCTVSFPSLKSLTVKGQGLCDILAMFRDAPILTSLHLRILDEPMQFFHWASIQVWWPQIKHLSMSWYLVEYLARPILDFLWSCSSLETLEEKTFYLPDFEARFTPLMLSRLRSLSVWSPQLLYYLDCPVLQTLELTLSEDVVDLIHFFSSVPHIHKLALTDLMKAEDEDTEDEDTGEEDTIKPYPSKLLECLASVDSGIFIFEPEEEALLRVIDKRWNVPPESQVTQLCQVHISCDVVGLATVMQKEHEASQNRTLARIDRLKSFKMEGLDISINAKHVNWNGPLEDRVLSIRTVGAPTICERRETGWV
ncbi:hypothetical protein EV421DRAFT_2019653 [Armillaria borealis]|uniref:F-box domain-containing protein n=1 Tax=Armillaria borealis TaxID=47425 RepID=A0AA39MQL7_9AGAR|nr:hypothetical protein EV421DRAFT_2019653 [Armillaria borealis]